MEHDEWTHHVEKRLEMWLTRASEYSEARDPSEAPRSLVLRIMSAQEMLDRARSELEGLGSHESRARAKAKIDEVERSARDSLTLQLEDSVRHLADVVRQRRSLRPSEAFHQFSEHFAGKVARAASKHDVGDTGIAAANRALLLAGALERERETKPDGPTKKRRRGLRVRTGNVCATCGAALVTHIGIRRLSGALCPQCDRATIREISAQLDDDGTTEGER